MLGYLEYLAVKFLAAIVRTVPRKIIILTGGGIGSLIYWLDGKHRRICLNNLRTAFREEKTEAELRKIARFSFMNLCQSFFEVLRFPMLKEETLDQFITIEGKEHLDIVRSQGKGGILLTAHYGNWELSAAWASLKGYPLSALAREQKQNRLNFLLNEYRRSCGIKVYTKGMAVRDLISAFKRNEFVGILGDQDAGRRGVFIEFFHHPASTHPGPVLLALRMGVPILPCFIVRSGDKHKIYVNPPLHIERRREENSKEEVVKNALQEFSQILESYIRRYPGQWLWVHRRWKTQEINEETFMAKSINIMILNDGKAGHLRQSQGIAQGFPSAKISEVKIDYKNNFWKVFLSIVSPLVKNSVLIKALLKKSLKEESFERLNAFTPNLIISAGSSLAACNLLYGRLKQAKKVISMRPGINSVKYFDLVIAPQHDHLPIIKNVLNTFVSPHPLREKDFKSSAKTLKEKFSIKGDRFLGLLVGGESSYFQIKQDTLKELSDNIKEISRTLGFKILVTTSRRTPLRIEKQLKKELEDFAGLELFISPREESYNPVGGIVGLSEVVVVTEDSLSMIAEAAASGRKVVVVQVDRKVRRKAPRHLQTLENLRQKGYLRLARVNNLNRTLKRIIKENFTPKVLNDTEKAIERVKELLVS